MLHTYVLTLGETGVRCDSEALWLRWEDIDFERGLLTVESVRKGRITIEREVKKGADDATAHRGPKVAHGHVSASDVQRRAYTLGLPPRTRPAPREGRSSVGRISTCVRRRREASGATSRSGSARSEAPTSYGVAPAGPSGAQGAEGDGPLRPADHASLRTHGLGRSSFTRRPLET